MPTPELRRQITFSARAATPDGYGTPVSGAFADQFTVFARVRPMRGGEDVMAARLGGRQPVVLSVRSTPSTRLIRTEWRATDAQDATRVYALRSITPDEKNRWIDILCEAGVAA